MLLESCIVKNISVKPYTYLSIETIDDGKKYLYSL